MGCQAGVEAANLTSKPYDTIKLGIDAHAKWYYVARQLDGATPQLVETVTFEPQDWRDHDGTWLPIDSTNSNP